MTRAVSSDRDLKTALASAEQALRETQRQYRELFEFASVGIFRSTPDGRLLEMNPAGLAMIQADALRDVLGHDVLPLVAPEYREAFGALAQRVSEGQSGTLEFELIGLRGARRWVDTHAVPLRTPQGEITALLAITRDVTERKLAEQALRDSEARLRIVTRATNDAVWDWDLVTNAVWWGEGLQTLFGYEPAEVEPTAESWYNRLHPDDHQRVVTSIRGAIESGRPFWTAEYRFRRRDGSYADVYDRGYVMHGPPPDRRPIRMVGSIMDVSDRKRAEKRLQSSRAALRQLATREQDIREDERARIAREIHDSLGQALTALKLDLAAAHAAAASGGTGVLERLAQTALLVDDLVKGVRRIATELRPAVLDQLGLPAAVEWLARDFSRRTGITCQTHIAADEAAIAKDVATALFRIVQESLTNVSRHAGARTVTIDLGVRSRVVALEICDDGGG
ncbi:MAG: PAS domain S-box protein, partial [Gemmatimonadales bacterium]|nr:PAS domain S-box protein [Gemmatimonadales bacterium]